MLYLNQWRWSLAIVFLRNSLANFLVTRSVLLLTPARIYMYIYGCIYMYCVCVCVCVYSSDSICVSSDTCSCPLRFSIRQHTSAYVSIRQHTSARVPFASLALAQASAGLVNAMTCFSSGFSRFS